MIRVLFSSDDAYVMPMAVAAYSALSHLDKNIPVEVHIVDGGILDSNITRLRAVLKRAHPDARLLVHRPDFSDLSEINVMRYSTASLSRLMMPHFFSDDVERVLYLDSDLVVDGNIADLWNLDLGSKAIWAVKNGSDYDFDRLLRSKFPDIDAPSNARYFNSGVLLVNLPQWRAHRISERSLEFLRAHSDILSFPDQDALNAVLAGDWGRLPRRWNKQVNRIGEPETSPVSETGVLHYTSHKPWRSVFPWKGKLTFQKAYIRSGWDRLDQSILFAAKLLLAQYRHHNRLRLLRYLPSFLSR